MYDEPYYGFERQSQLNRVSGLAEVNKMRIPKGSTVPFFHDSEDIFFIKSSDADGMGVSVRAFEFHEIDIADLEPVTMTRAEFNEWKELLANAKLIIQQAGKSEPETAIEAEPIPKSASAGNRFTENKNTRRNGADIIDAVP